MTHPSIFQKMANNIPNSEQMDIATKSELLRIMECPVCHEIPFPPIYLCIRGHNICKNCKPKLKECPTCKGTLAAETRNFTVEQLVLASKHTCPYKEDGCLIELRGDFMENHTKNCSYRPFKCPWFDTDNCDMLKLSLAVDHILMSHSAAQPCTGPTQTLKYSLMFYQLMGGASDRQLGPDKIVLWPPYVIEFDGKVFFPLTFTMNQMICFTLLCVGSEADAQKYRVKIVCQPGKEMEIQWTVPVHSIMKGAELRNTETRCNVFISSCTLHDLIQMADICKIGYIFSTCYTILKV